MNHLVIAAFLLFAVVATPYVIYGGVYIVFKPSDSSARKQAATPTVSVVLPTHNEGDIITAKLEDIVSLDYPMEKVEVVVVDASDDGTAETVRDFFTHRDAPSLTLVREEERRGAAVALNTGVAASSNELIFRTDADSMLDDDVLREAAANLSDPEVGAVTGRQIEVLGKSKVEEDYRNILAILQLVESHIDSTFIFHGPCGAFRRSLFEPIDEDSLADDSEVALRIRRQGHRVVLDPAMSFVESGVSEFRARRHRKDRRAMGLVRLLWRHRDALGRYGRYGRVILPFNWWFMVVSPWLFLLGTLLISAAAVIYVGMLGFVVPTAIIAFWFLGQRDSLGPIQPIYAILDAHVSLLFAQFRLVVNEEDGIWEIDRESRRVFE